MLRATSRAQGGAIQNGGTHSPSNNGILQLQCSTILGTVNGYTIDSHTDVATRRCSTGQYRTQCSDSFRAGRCLPCNNAPDGFGYDDDGGYVADSCPTIACKTPTNGSCPLGMYRHSCNEHFEGTCELCTNAAANHYYTSHGNNSNTCPTEDCSSLAACPDGYYRYGCGGSSQGTCMPTMCELGTFYSVPLGACANCSVASWCPGGLPVLGGRAWSR